MRIKGLFVEFTLVKRFYYIFFLGRCKIMWVNDLFADEICQKKCKRGKMWRKMSNEAIFVVARGNAKLMINFFWPNLCFFDYLLQILFFADIIF